MVLSETEIIRICKMAISLGRRALILIEIKRNNIVVDYLYFKIDSVSRNPLRIMGLDQNCLNIDGSMNIDQTVIQGGNIDLTRLLKKINNSRNIKMTAVSNVLQHFPINTNKDLSIYNNRSPSTRRRGVSPRRRGVSPRRNSPRRRGVSPRRISMSPRRRSMSPRRRSVSPRTEINIPDFNLGPSRVQVDLERQERERYEDVLQRRFSESGGQGLL